jgi:putative membrane protein
MIDYNPKEWFRYIFYFQKADTVRKLTPLILTIGVYSAIVAYVLIVYLKLGENNDLKNISLMHSLLGFVISMLLVFRTNTAYDRWWEGRKQWGTLMNSSRNLALKINGLLDHEHVQERDFFKKMIPNYGFALKNHLRNRFHPEEFEDSAYFLPKVPSICTITFPIRLPPRCLVRSLNYRKRAFCYPSMSFWSMVNWNR